MYTEAEERALRLDVFAWLDEQLRDGRYELRRADLLAFTWRGADIPLLDHGGRGIRNPSKMRTTLSITTTLKSPYRDAEPVDGFARYDYRAGDGGDNRKLVAAFKQRSPLVYFRQSRVNYYVADYPAYIVHNDPVARQVTVALDEALTIFGDPMRMGIDERAYAERIARSRLHQPLFRARVLHAYADACAICQLRHPQLLDAAHIIADSERDGLAVVTNGLSLCKIHHSAYDQNLLGITPDYEVRIDEALLDEVDGPMLRHGLQDMHGRALALPGRVQDRPSREALARRYESFAA